MDDEHFSTFSEQLKLAIESYGPEPQGTRKQKQEIVLRVQKEQFERLNALEEEFRLRLVRHHRGGEVYRVFVKHVHKDLRSVSDARPYFRERQDLFDEQISPVLRAGQWRPLLGFHINWHFVRFVLATGFFPGRSPLRVIAKKISTLRDELVVTNIPLGISRSRLFSDRNPRAPLEFMDFVQFAAEGLLAAVDKFCLPFTPVWRSVAIGRMTGNFIEANSATWVNFSSDEQRALYRANKVLARDPHGLVDFSAVVDAVNDPAVCQPLKKKNPKPAKKPKKAAAPRRIMSSDEVARVMAAASVLSADSPAPGTDEDIPASVARYEAPSDWRPDVRAERAEIDRHLRVTLATLPLRERKFLYLRGIDAALEFAA